MNRRAIVRGIQLVVAITLAAFTWVTWRAVSKEGAGLSSGLADVRPVWLVVAAACALQEGVCGGLRIWMLGRVLWPGLRVRTAIVSEFVLMFCAGVTPGQAGAAPAQIGVLVHGGMRFVDVATAELLTASCTILFFLLSAVTVFVFRARGLLVVGAGLDWLVGVSVVVFGAALSGLVLAATYPPILKGLFRAVSAAVTPIGRALLSALARTARLGPWARKRLDEPGTWLGHLLVLVDDFHAGVRVFARRGKVAYLGAFALTFAFFCSRFAVAYFLLLALGIPTTPSTFVAVGPPFVQVLLVQALLNFALYLSPTPSASGVAEAGSTSLMGPWVHGAVELPYLVLWRLLAMFLCMFVGGVYVFRYLGTDVLEARVKEAEQARKTHEIELTASNATQPAAAAPLESPIAGPEQS